MGCCKANDDVRFEVKVDSFGINEDRHCTDVIFLLLFIIAGIGMIVVASQAFSKGQPSRLYFATDYEGNTCGHGTAPIQIPEAEWKEREQIYLPSTSDASFGICIKDCPTSIVFNGVETYDGKQKFTTYPSKETFHRCIPTSDEVVNGSSTNAITDKLEDGEFFRRGFGELANSWRVILTAAFLTCVLCFLWIMLLRYTVVFMVWFTLILLFAILLTSSLIVWFTLAENNNATSQDVWNVVAIILFLLTAIYLVLLLWFIRRIKIAIQIIKESTKAFGSIHGIFILPIILFVAMGVLTVWHLFIAVYLQSAGKIDDQAPEPTATDLGSFNGTFNVFASEKSLQYAQIYNLFMFFWNTAYFEALEYCTIGGAVIAWYFSSVGEDKKAPDFAIIRSFKRAFLYHSGSLFLGSLLIAIVKTVRFIFNRFQGKIKKVDKGHASCCTKCCCNCLLGCLQKLIEFVSKNAYIMIAMHGASFCDSARHVLSLIIDNAFKVAILNFISDLVLFLSKILITLMILLISRSLLSNSTMAPGVTSELFPLIFIGLITFVICTLWMRVFDTCIDTVLICFMEDRSVNDGTNKPYYMPQSLAELVEK